MQSSHSLDCDKWNASRNRIRDVTTSKKWEPPSRENSKTKVLQKYPLRVTPNILSAHLSGPLPNITVKTSASKTQKSTTKNISVHSTPSKSNTLKLLQDKMQMIDNLTNGNESYAKIQTRSTRRVTNLNSLPAKIKSNHSQQQKLQTCFKDAVESPKSIKNSMNASISSTHLNGHYFSDRIEPEKDLQCILIISDFVDTLEIKSNSQHAFEMRNIGTQMNVFKNAEYIKNVEKYEEIFNVLSQDCENLISTLKIHKYRQNLNEIFRTQSLPSRDTTSLQNKLQEFPKVRENNTEFVDILEDLFNFHKTALEPSLFKPKTDLYSESESCPTEESKDKNVSDVSIKQVETLNETIENSNRLVIDLKEIAKTLQSVFETIKTKNSDCFIMTTSSTSDYKTAISIKSNRKNDSEADKTEQPSEIFDKDEVSVCLPRDDLDNNENLDSKVVIIKESAEHNNIKSSIAKVSAELMTILQQMKYFDELQTRAKNSSSKMQSYNDKMKTIKSVNKIENATEGKQNLRLYKSQTDVSYCSPTTSKLCSKHDWLHNIMPKNSDDALTSNFSTCTEISFEDFHNSEPQHYAGDICFVNNNKTKSKSVENVYTPQDIEKVVSTVSTNTDFEYLPNNCKSSCGSSISTYKIKKFSNRRLKKRKLKYGNSENVFITRRTPINHYKISEFCSTFATKSKQPNSPTQSKNKKLVVLSQSPSVGDIKYVCKEFDEDSAINMNSPSSCGEYEGAVSQNLLSLNSSNALSSASKPNHQTGEAEAKTYLSTPYPETSLTYDQSVTFVDISLNDAKSVRTPTASQEEIFRTTRDAETLNSTKSTITEILYSEAGVQNEVSCNDMNVQSVSHITRNSVAVQNEIPQTDKDISTADMLDSKSLFEECTKPVKSLTNAKHISTNTDFEFSSPVILPVINFGNDIVCAVKEKCANVPPQVMQTVMNRLQNNFKHNFIDDLKNLPYSVTNPSSVNVSFAITSVRCIGENTLLVKWSYTSKQPVQGFEIFINNDLKMKIHSGVRNSAVIDFVQPKSTLFICICAMTETGPSQKARATFKMA